MTQPKILPPRDETEEEARVRISLQTFRPLQEEIQNTMRALARNGAGLDAKPESNPFPVELLPELPREMAAANALALNLPVDFGAVSVLGVLSACLGKGITLRYKSHSVRPNLYFLLAAESGTGKSETLRALMRPVFEYQAQATRDWEVNRHALLIARKEAVNRRIKKLNAEKDEHVFVKKRADEERELRELERQIKNPHVLVCEDASGEAFVERLAACNGQTFSYSPDAGRVLDNLFGRIAGTGSPDESHYLKAFSGDPIFVERIRRVASSVPDPCATLLWVTTPDRLSPVLKNETLMRGGFLARVLLAVVSTTDSLEPRDAPPAVPPAVIERYNGLITGLLTKYRLRPEEKGPAVIRCSRDADHLFTDFHNDTVLNASKSGLNKEAARRYRELALRLAVVLHAATHGSTAHQELLSTETAFNAATLVTWFGNTAEGMAAREAHESFEDKVWAVWQHIQKLAPLHEWRVFPRWFYRRQHGGRAIVANAAEAHAILCEWVAQERLDGPISLPYPKNRMTYYVVREGYRGHSRRNGKGA